MLIKELITEAYDVSKARIDHPEDLVLTQGSAGAQLALDILKKATEPSSEMSFKPDGKPAIMWGRDSGGFALGDKYMKPLPHSIEELAQMLQSRRGGGREDLIRMYADIWPAFEASVPGINGYLFGDLVYSSTPPMQNGKYVFKPNTVTYTVDANSELGKKIGQSRVGIVVHSYFPPDSRVGKHVDDPEKIAGVETAGELLIIPDSINKPEQITVQNLGQISSAIGSNASGIDQLLDPNTLTEKKMKAFPGLLTKYINARVKQRSFDNLAKGFVEWIDSNASSAMAQKIKNHIQENLKGYNAAMQIFLLITQAKNSIINQLDSVEGGIQAATNNDPGHEGYLVHTSRGPIKLVDRFKFSAANFGA